MNVKALAAIVGTLSLGALATGCASNKAAEGARRHRRAAEARPRPRARASCSNKGTESQLQGAAPPPPRRRAPRASAARAPAAAQRQEVSHHLGPGDRSQTRGRWEESSCRPCCFQHEEERRTCPHAMQHRHGLKPLGAGIGLRRELLRDAAAHRAHARLGGDHPRELPHAWAAAPQRTLDACAERWTVLPHGVGLNIGGPDALDEDYVTRLAALVRRVDAPFFSDHLCYSRLGGVYLHDLLPLPFTEEAVEHVVPRVREVMARVERPFLLENPSYYAPCRAARWPRPTSCATWWRQADCGLLLDVNNVYVNAQNHGYDAARLRGRAAAGARGAGPPGRP